jgi:hypothetical protein
MNARAGVINVLSGCDDPTFGAVLWDGQDLLKKGKNHRKFKEYISVTINPHHMMSFYAANKEHVNPSPDFKSNYTSVKLLKFTAKGEYYHLSSIQVHGGTIFWGIAPPQKVGKVKNSEAAACEPPRATRSMNKLIMCVVIMICLILQSSCTEKLFIKNKEGNSVTRHSKVELLVDDTLTFDFNHKCDNIADSFFVCYQVAIPTLFHLRDSVSATIDGIKHHFIILQPKALVHSDEDNDKDCQLSKNRILVHFTKENSTVVIQNKYTNLVSNSGGVSSQFSHIEIKDQDLIIQHNFGNRYYYEYKMYLKIKSKALLLKKIEVDCNSPENKRKGAEYLFKDLAVSTINIDDTISNNCGCDNYWK